MTNEDSLTARYLLHDLKLTPTPRFADATQINWESKHRNFKSDYGDKEFVVSRRSSPIDGVVIDGAEVLSQAVSQDTQKMVLKALTVPATELLVVM